MNQKTLLFLILTVLLISSPVSSFGSELTVKNEGGLLSISAKEASVEEIFNAISGKFGLYIKVYPEMKQVKVSAAFNKLSLEDGIKTIIKENYALVIRNNKIEAIYILNKGKDFQTRNQAINKFIENKFLNTDELIQVVTINVKKEYPNTTLFDLIPHEDIQGNLVSYAFCYYLGEGNAPSKKEIKMQISHAWEAKKTARKNIKEGYKTRDSSKIIDWMEKTKKYDHELRRNDEFITLEISATYESPPIKSFYKGIAYDISMYPNAEELLKDEIGSNKNVVLNRTFRLNPLAIGFEFQDDNQQKYYVDVLNRKVFTKWRERIPKNSRQADPEKKERIRNQWLDFLGP